MSPAELRKCVRAAVGEELTAEEAETAVEVADWDGDGLLGVEDLARFAEKGRNLREAFRVYEMEGEGRITPRSLRAALGRMGERRTEEDCEAMIRRFDIDGDGFLSFDEFKVMLL
ncbi:Putative calcium-binding protein CML19 [Apostasia shenzhenica]|uniref:Calcium-binding protein CML19 n=1 Tax=Apostasia shenzhenica TaxID=1088818 RepID=A0A2H9ZYE2_9ASPA|nr:Putative calcium-binding protein CML19 [Apostasia shenzhenica]PKA48331.1 Putative calcium-binding protein CML19 [Apostasia shenzhenica]